MKEAAEAAARAAQRDQDARQGLQPEVVTPPLAPEPDVVAGSSGDPPRQVRFEVPESRMVGENPAELDMEVEVPADASPTGSMKRGGDGASESAKQRRIGKLDVCSIDQVGRGGEYDGYDEPEQEVKAEPETAPLTPEMHPGESMAEYQVPIPDKPVYGTRSGELLDPQKVQVGRQKEYDSILRHGVMELVKSNECRSGAAHVRGGWVEDYKGDVVRSRFVAKQVAYERRADVSQSTPALLVFRLMMSLAASAAPIFQGEPVVIGVWDISVAFFHSQMDELVYVHPPKDLVPAGWCWKLVRSMYGTRRASRLWADHVRDVLQADGANMVRVISMAFVNEKRRYVAAVWGDDFMFIAGMQGMHHIAEVLERNFESKLIGMIGPGCATSTVKILNRILAWTEKGFEWHADDKHSREVVRRLNLTQGSSYSSVPGSKMAGASVKDGEDELDPDSAKEYASLAGTLLYHAIDRPDLQFVVGKLMASLMKPLKKHMAQLKICGRYLIRRTCCAWKFEYQSWPGEISVLCDADWASDGSDRRSVDCTHMFLGGHLLETSSSRQQIVALSSAESEFYGITRAAAAGIQVRECLAELGLVTKLRVFSDSSAARGMVARSGSGRVKHIETRYLWIQDRVRRRQLTIESVDTSHNTSDLGTKYHPSARLEELVRMLPMAIGDFLPCGLPQKLSALGVVLGGDRDESR